MKQSSFGNCKVHQQEFSTENIEKRNSEFLRLKESGKAYAELQKYFKIFFAVNLYLLQLKYCSLLQLKY